MQAFTSTSSFHVVAFWVALAFMNAVLYYMTYASMHCNCNCVVEHVKPQPAELPPLTCMLSKVHSDMRRGRWSLLAVYVGTAHDAALNARWTSQVGQDRSLFKLFDGKRDGFFVDLAANDAVHFSNTLTLEQEYGWTGLCIEANPAYIELLTKRNCQVVQAVVGEMDNVEVQFVFNGGTGGVVGAEFDNKAGSDKALKTVSLQNMFYYIQVPRVIDYMSLDIEGAEEWAFQNFPWNRYTFSVITAERPKDNLRKVLVFQGYTYVCDHGDFGDELWIHSTFATLEHVMDKLNIHHSRLRESKRPCS